ncbi:MAG: hypothetical protein CME06_00190 [Gemmatimonadetes bacterium]|nr:hypothetical protein [Gemmatimonadota bacterium]
MRATSARRIALAILALIAIRLWLVLTATGSFSHADDLWLDRFEEETRAESIAGVISHITDYSYYGFSGGSRFGAILYTLTARTFGPSYIWIKAWAVLWSAATLAAFCWLVRRELSRPALALFCLFFIVPPVYHTVLSLLFMGNHVELPLLIALTLGFGLRSIGGNPNRDRRFALALGVCCGLGAYYCQTFYLWLAVLTPLLLIEGARGIGPTRTLRRLPWVLAGAAPGLSLLLVAYWPEHAASILFPYDKDLPRLLSDRGDLTPTLSVIWTDLFTPLADDRGAIRIGARIGASIVWLPLGILAAATTRSRDLRAILGSFVAFSLLLLWTATTTGVAARRHVIELVPILMLIQAVVLGDLIPGIATYFRGDRLSLGARRSIVALGIGVGVLILIPRSIDHSRLGGAHSIREGIAYSAPLVRRLDLDGVATPHQRALVTVLDRIDSEGATEFESSLIALGIRSALRHTSGANIDDALPTIIGERIDPQAYADKLEYMLHRELWPRAADLASFLPSDQAALYRADGLYSQRLYYLGVSIGAGLLWATPDFRREPPELVCQGCRMALDEVWDDLESDRLMRYLQEIVCTR